MLKDRAGEIKCGWCGGPMSVLEGYEARNVQCAYGDMENTVEQYDLVFCCEGCHWAYQVDQHKLIGLHGKALREHIIEAHDGVPEAAAGRQCREAYERSARFAEHLLGMMTGEAEAVTGMRCS